MIDRDDRDAGVEEIQRLNALGIAALSRGRTMEAARLLEAAVRLLRVSDDSLAPLVYENLGTAYLRSRLAGPALRAFLRALDGVPTSREPSLRHAVTCFVNRSRFQDAARYLGAYERRFGPHPDGWSREYLDERLAALRRGRTTSV